MRPAADAAARPRATAPCRTIFGRLQIDLPVMTMASSSWGDCPLTPPRLIEQVRAEIRACHYSRRTEDAYVHWIRRFIVFHGRRHPRELGAPEISGLLPGWRWSSAW